MVISSTPRPLHASKLELLAISSFAWASDLPAALSFARRSSCTIGLMLFLNFLKPLMTPANQSPVSNKNSFRRDSALSASASCLDLTAVLIASRLSFRRDRSLSQRWAPSKSSVARRLISSLRSCCFRITSASLNMRLCSQPLSPCFLLRPSAPLSSRDDIFGLSSACQ